MIELIVDPSMFEIPNIAVSSDEAEDVIFRIEAIKDWMDEGYPVRFVALSNFDDDLAFVYPDFASIDAFLQMNNLNGVFSASDVHSFYQSVIDRLSYCQDDDIGEPVFEVPTIEFEQEADNHQDIPDTLRNTLATCAFRKSKGIASNVVVIEGVIPNPNVLVSFPYTDVVNKTGSVGLSGEVNQLLVRSFIELEDLMIEDVYSEVWGCATCSKGLYSAVWLAIAGKHVGEGLALDEFSPNFYFGSDFYSTISKYQCSSGGKFSSATMKSCILCILEESKISHKVFHGPSKRDDDTKAHRAHITKSGVALRLLTWEKRPAMIEFANVGPKKELKIERGDRAKRFPLH